MGRAAEGYVEGDSSGQARLGGTIIHLYKECPTGSTISYKIPVSALSASARKSLSWCGWCHEAQASESGNSPSEGTPPCLIAYEFIAGPMDGRQLMLSPFPEGFEWYIVRLPVEGPIIRDAQGRDNMRESSYKVTYDPKTGRGMMIWQGEK